MEGITYIHKIRDTPCRRRFLVEPSEQSSSATPSAATMKLVLLCAVAQGVQASTIDLATLTTSDIPTGVVAQNGDVLTGTLSLRIKVSIAAGASVDA